MDQLQSMLQPSHFSEIDSALTLKVLRSGIEEQHQYIACPNSKCNNVGFLTHVCCKEQVECNDCGITWRLKSQPSSTPSFMNWISLEALYNSNTYSDLYKVMYSQMCPSCKVMIVRSEGCKFMECAKCKFQFCWLCLSDFYTEYHYYESLCPLRIVPIYASILLGFLFLLIRIYYICELVKGIVDFFFIAIISQLMSLGLLVLFIASFYKFKKAFEVYRLLRSTQAGRTSRSLQRQLTNELRTEFLVGGLLIFLLAASTLFLQLVVGRMCSAMPGFVVKSLPIQFCLVGALKGIQSLISRNTSSEVI